MTYKPTNLHDKRSVRFPSHMVGIRTLFFYKRLYAEDAQIQLQIKGNGARKKLSDPVRRQYIKLPLSCDGRAC